MMGGAKAKMIQRAAANIDIRETGLARRLAHEAAVREFEQARAVRDLLAAAGLDADTDPQPVEDRRDELLACADAVASQEFPRWWWDRYGDRLTDNPDEARECVGLTGQEWRSRIVGWHGRYYDRGVVDVPPSDAGPRDLAVTAAKHVETAHGLTLRQFVAEVVNWNPQRHLRAVLAGPLEGHTAAIRQVAAELDE